MSHRIRPARADELASAEALVTGSINELCVRHGFGPIATLRPPDFQVFCLNDDPRGLWVAEDNGEIVGFAMSWVCNQLWFLAELFVAPGRQGQGIGNELLDRTLQQASQAKTTQKALITFAFNVVSQGLYVRHGLLPREPIHLCTASRESLMRPAPGPVLRTIPIQPTADDFQSLARIDDSALGVSLAKHHQCLLGDPKVTGIFFEDRGQRVGYAYIATTGHIGPLAVTRSDAMPSAFNATLAAAAAGGAAQISIFVPGSSDALSIAASYGMRFALPMVLMSSGDFGDWTRYCSRNPGFM